MHAYPSRAGGLRLLPWLATAAMVHALALVGLPVQQAPREALAIDSAPVELRFVAPAPVEPAATTPPVEEPPPVPRPEPRPEPKPEPKPKPEPGPEPRPEPKPEPPPEPEPEPRQPPDPPPDAAQASEAPPENQPVQARQDSARPVTRFAGKPARNARAWFGQLAAWIDANKYYPVESKKRKQQGTVVVKFTLDRDGRLLGSWVKTSSGHAELDRAALDALARAAPFPPIPAFIDRNTVSISVPIDFTLVTE